MEMAVPQRLRETVRLAALVVAGAATSAVITGIAYPPPAGALAPFILLASALCAVALLAVTGRTLPASLVAVGALLPALLWSYAASGAP